ncbi:hypothetical protein B9Z55_027991 [Caenorhabditis nigoni]|nr:hypothetical protein B9Z55_027991 [Caenorhabditis nigoni]
MCIAFAEKMIVVPRAEKPNLRIPESSKKLCYSKFLKFWNPENISDPEFPDHDRHASPKKIGPHKPSPKRPTTKSPVAKFPTEIESPTIQIPKIEKLGEEIKKYAPMLAQCLKIYKSASLG